MTRPLALLVLLIAPAARAADVTAVVTPRAEAFLAGKKNVGLVVGVWHAGKPHVYGFGTVVLPGGKQTPAGDTLFEIGSITKAFTGVLLAEAVRRGEVKLDAPARDYLPADVPLPKAGDAPITLAHLATHRSGLPVQPVMIGLLAKDPANPYADFDRKKLADHLKVLKPARQPGAKYEYSNLGAGIAGHAVVHAARADSFDALVKERVCKPLGMKDTAEALTGAQRARWATPHDKEGRPVSPWDFACLEGCGGLRSTADDLLKFAAANLGEVKTPLLPALTLSHEPRADGRDDAERLGLFWHLAAPGDGRTRVWHNGGTPGSHSMLAMVPATKTAVVVLCTGPYFEADDLALDVLGELQK